MRQVLLRVQFLLILVSFIKTEWPFVLLCQNHRILFDFKSSHFVCLLDSLISRNKNFRRYGFASELLLESLFFLSLLLMYHFLNLFLPNCLRPGLLSQVKIERFRDSYPVLALLAARSIRIVTSCQLSVSEIFFVEGTSNGATFG